MNKIAYGSKQEMVYFNLSISNNDDEFYGNSFHHSLHNLIDSLITKSDIPIKFQKVNP